jgi:hypothetical protein
MIVVKTKGGGLIKIYVPISKTDKEIYDKLSNDLATRNVRAISIQTGMDSFVTKNCDDIAEIKLY